MSRVRGKDTKPEILIRRALHKRGLRYKLHDSTLPGKPDIIFPKYKAVVLVHGCFWHFHQCRLSNVPATRTDWWLQKLQRTRCRDAEVMKLLNEQGWRVATVWECAFRETGAPAPVEISGISDRVKSWLISESKSIELPAVVNE